MKRLTAILPRLAGLCVFLGFINFFAFMATSTRAGGSALNGYMQDNRYYLNNKGTYIEVSQALWKRQRLHEMSVFVTHPLTMFAMSYILRASLANTLYRAPQTAIAQTVATVRTSGSLLRAIDCAGSFGGVHASGPLIHVEIYPGGMLIKLPTLAPVALRGDEITALREKKSWSERGIEIIHRSSQTPSPIRLRCEHNKSFCTTLERISQQHIQRVSTA
jgi:hypothetical protein